MNICNSTVMLPFTDAMVLESIAEKLSKEDRELLRDIIIKLDTNYHTCNTDRISHRVLLEEIRHSLGNEFD